MDNQPDPNDVSPQQLPSTAGGGDSGLPPNVAAGIAALFPLVGGIIIWLVEKKDAFVRFNAMQSIYFGAAMLVASVVLTVVSAVLAFIPILGWMVSALLFLVLYGVAFVLWLMHLWKAFSGVRWEMPVVGAMAREQVARASVT